MENVFTNIYERCVWGNNGIANYNGSSGPGSDVDYNKASYIPFLQKYILDNHIETVVDLGCGDFRCGPYIYDELPILYTGYDAYDKVIKNNQSNHSLPKYDFIHSCFLEQKESLVNADLCILKDVLQHWTTNDIYTFLDYVVASKKYKYILICNCCNQVYDHLDTCRGGFRQLNCNLLPLKKYNPMKVYEYDTKQVCVIST